MPNPRRVHFILFKSSHDTDFLRENWKKKLAR